MLSNHTLTEQSSSLPEKNRKAWQQDAESIRIPDSFDPYSSLLSIARKLAENYLPLEIKEQIAKINKPGGLTYFHLQGMPEDSYLPPTPQDGKRPPSKLTAVSELVLLGIVSILGEPFAYLEQKQGDLVQQVVPIRAYPKNN